MSDQKQRILTGAFCIYAVTSLISMATMSIGAGILVAALLWAFGGPKPLWIQIRDGLRSSVFEKRYLQIALALTLVCVGSLVWGKVSPLSYGDKFSEIHVLKDSLKLWYLFWPLILVAGLSALSLDHREKILYSWIGTCAVLGVVAVIQHFTGWPRPQTIPSPLPPLRYHATLFLGHHLSVASVLIFPFFASLDFARKRSHWVWKIAAVLGGVALFLTYSRTLWAALPVALVIWALLNLPRRWTYALAALMIVGAGVALQLSSVRARFSTGAFQEGVGPRSDLWKANFEFIKERPLLGVGWKHNQELSGYYLMQKYPGQSVFSGHAHNNFIDMLGGTGILGAAAWLAWSVFAMATAWIVWRRRSSEADVFASGLFCAWIAFQINGLTQVNFWEAKVTHQAMWMIAWSLLWLLPRETSQQQGRNV